MNTLTFRLSARAMLTVCAFLVVVTAGNSHAGREVYQPPLARIAAPNLIGAQLPTAAEGISSTSIVNEAEAAKTNEASPEQRQQVIDAYGKLPLSFFKNQGQIDFSVAYHIQQPRQAIYFTPTGIHFTLSEVSAKKSGENPVSTEATTGRSHRLWLSLLNADPRTPIRALEKTDGGVSYFRGDKDRWKTGIPTAISIEYVKPWPGIDLQYRGNSGRLESFFVVGPNADPGQIALRYEGAEKIEIDSSGNLLIHTPLGVLTETAPVSYQDIGNQRHPVESRFVLNDGQTVTLALGDYDRSRILVIDPAMFMSDTSAM